MTLPPSFSNKCVFLACLAAASHTYAESIDNRELEELYVSGSRYQQAQQDLIGSYSQVDADALALVQQQHIQEALARLPGVNFHRNNGQEYLPALRSPVLSGAGACGSFLMAEDGIPLRPAGFCNVNELFEAHSEQASRIEVIRGPGNVYYGSNALHGVVNVIGAARVNQPATLGLELGPDDYQQIQFSGGTEHLGATFSGRHDGGYRDDSGVDQQKLSVRYARQLQNIYLESGLTSINLNQETAGFIEGFEAYKDKALVKSNSNPEAYRDAKATRWWLRLQDSQTNPAWVVTPYLRYSDMAFLQHFLPGTPLEENGQTSAGVQTAFYFGNDVLRWSLGADAEWADGWLKQTQNQPTQGSAFLQATVPAGKHYDYDVRSLQFAPFAQADWQVTDDLQLVAGLRYEYLGYDYDNNMLAGRTRDDGTVCGFGGCRYSRPESSTNSFTNVSPKLGLLYKLNDTQQLYVNIAQGFRAPQVTELYRLQREQAVADLDSEELLSVEVGFRGEYKALSHDVTLYAMEKNNVIYRDSAFFNVSDGTTEHAGIEADLAYAFNQQWKIRTVATLARHRYKDAGTLTATDIVGNDVDTAPRAFGSVFLEWKPQSQTRLEVEWQHMGSYYTDPENEHKYSGHDLIHVRGTKQLTSNISVAAKLLNALDAEYADRADYTGFSGDRYLPGARRTLYGTVTYQW